MEGVGLENVIALIGIIGMIVGIILVYFLLKAKVSYVEEYKG